MPLNPLSFNAVFVGEAALKEQSIINDNVDMKMLTPTIKFVQDTFLMRMLGTGLFVDLQNKIANMAGNIVQVDGVYPNLTADDIFLLNAYIQPMMVWGVMKEAPIALTYKYMNKGVEKMSSDNAQSAPVAELEKLADWAYNKFDWYAQRLVYYLNANTQLYPTYLVVKTLDDLAPSVRGYRSKLYIGNGREGTGVCDPTFYYR